MLYFSPIASAANTTKNESPLLRRVQSEKKGQNELWRPGQESKTPTSPELNVAEYTAHTEGLR